MEIKGVNKGFFSKIYGNRQAKGSSLSKEEFLGCTDSVDISNRAKEMQKLVQDGLQIDDVRMDRVEELKERIETGQYYVPTKLLAAAILKYINWIGR